MKALTLTQPWASLVILGVKRWETRSWVPGPGHRGGRLVIHAAKGWTAEDREFASELYRRGVLTLAPAGLPRGAVLGTVRFDGLARTTTAITFPDCTALERELGDYSPGRYAWLFGDPRPFDEPIRARGSLGLWEWTDHS